MDFFYPNLFNNPCVEYTYYEVCREIARALHAKGIGGPEPISFTEEDVEKYLGGVRQSHHCRC